MRFTPVPHPDPDPDRLPRVITRADAIARGMSRHAVDHRVSTGRWRRLLPRTYLTVDTLTEYDRMNAALAFAGAGALLSGAAALRASEVRRIRMPNVVLVLVPPPNRTGSAEWVRVRRTFRPLVREQWSGPARVEVARAAADAALASRSLDDVRTLIARVVQDGRCSHSDLVAELQAGPRQGSGYLRTALEEIGAGAESAPEAQAARILRTAGISDFVQNAVIALPNGSTRRVDFYWPRLRACLEIDSVEWHFDRADWTATWDRHLELTKFGYSVIHRPPSALREQACFVRDVREWLAGRTAELQRGVG